MEGKAKCPPGYLRRVAGPCVPLVSWSWEWCAVLLGSGGPSSLADPGLPQYTGTPPWP